MNKTVPLTWNHDPDKLIGYVTITSEEFLHLIQTSDASCQPELELGWGLTLPDKSIIEFAVISKPWVASISDLDVPRPSFFKKFGLSKK